MFTRVGYIASVYEAVKDHKTPAAVPSPEFRGSFSREISTDSLRLQVEADVTVAGKTYHTNNAIFDTGATITAASNQFIEKIPADYIDRGTAYGVAGSDSAAICSASISLPGGVMFSKVDLWFMELPERFGDLLIGMDLISQGDLSLKHEDGRLILSFSVC